MLATITNTVNSASVVGNQLYDPYGNSRYQSGSMVTSKGFTGQYNDSLTGLDYYGSRYYDPTAGVFLSSDPIAGNLAGTNPYEYVGANPETNTDLTGQMYAPLPGSHRLFMKKCRMIMNRLPGNYFFPAVILVSRRMAMSRVMKARVAKAELVAWKASQASRV